MPWLEDPLRRHIRDFERVLNAAAEVLADYKAGVFP